MRVIAGVGCGNIDKANEPAINYVKEAVFGLKEGTAISHPTLNALLKVVPKGAPVFVSAPVHGMALTFILCGRPVHRLQGCVG